MNDKILNFVIFPLILYLFFPNLVVPGFFVICVYVIFYRLKSAGYNLKALNYNLKPRILVVWGIFLLWSLCTVVWSEDAWKTLISLLRVSAITGGLWVFMIFFRNFNFVPENIVSNKTFFILILLNILIFTESLTGYSTTVFARWLIGADLNVMQPLNKSIAMFTILVPVLYGLLSFKNYQLITLVIITAAAYSVIEMQAAQLALISAGIAISAHCFLGKNAVRLFFILVAGFLLLSPFIYGSIISFHNINELHKTLPLSWRYRFEMWDKVVLLIKHNPFFGWGFGASAALNDVLPEAGNVIIQVHPHNQFLQLWLETGAVGVSIIIFMLYFICIKILELDEKTARYVLGSLASGLIFMLFSFSAWQSWWLCSVMVMIVVIYVMQRSARTTIQG